MRALDPKSSMQNEISTAEMRDIERFASTGEEKKFVRDLANTVAMGDDGYAISEDESKKLINKYPSLAPQFFKLFAEHSPIYSASKIFANPETAGLAETKVSKVLSDIGKTIDRTRELGFNYSEEDVKKFIETDDRISTTLNHFCSLLNDHEIVDKLRRVVGRYHGFTNISLSSLYESISWISSSWVSSMNEELFLGGEFESFVKDIENKYGVDPAENLPRIFHMYTDPLRFDHYINSETVQVFREVVEKYRLPKAILPAIIVLRKLVNVSDQKSQIRDFITGSVNVTSIDQALYIEEQMTALPDDLDFDRVRSIQFALGKYFGLKFGCKRDEYDRLLDGTVDYLDFIHFAVNYNGKSEDLKYLAILGEELPIDGEKRDLSNVIKLIQTKTFQKNYWQYRREVTEGDPIGLWSDMAPAEGGLGVLASADFNLKSFDKLLKEYVAPQLEFKLEHVNPSAYAVLKLLKKYKPDLRIEDRSSLSALAIYGEQIAKALKDPNVRSYIEFYLKIMPDKKEQLVHYVDISEQKPADLAKKILAPENYRLREEIEQFVRRYSVDAPPSEIAAIASLSDNDRMVLFAPENSKAVKLLSEEGVPFGEIVKCAADGMIPKIQRVAGDSGLYWLFSESGEFNYDKLKISLGVISSSDIPLSSFADFMGNYAVMNPGYRPKTDDLHFLTALYQHSSELQKLKEVDFSNRYTSPVYQVSIINDHPEIFIFLDDPLFVQIHKRISDLFDGDILASMEFYATVAVSGELLTVVQDKRFKEVFKNISAGSLGDVPLIPRHKMELAVCLAYYIQNTGWDNGAENFRELIKEAGRPIFPNDIITILVAGSSPKLKELYFDQNKLDKAIEKLAGANPNIIERRSKQLHMEQGLSQYTERPSLEELPQIDKIKLFLGFEAMQDGKTRDDIDKLIAKDITDEKGSELGGVVVWRGKPVFEELPPLQMGDNKSFDPAEKIEVKYFGESARRPGSDDSRYNNFNGGIINFHLHAINYDNSDYAGPSGHIQKPMDWLSDAGDFGHTRQTGQAGLVITTLGLNSEGAVSWNADFYTVLYREGPRISYTPIDNYNPFTFTFDYGTYRK